MTKSVDNPHLVKEARLQSLLANQQTTNEEEAWENNLSSDDWQDK